MEPDEIYTSTLVVPTSFVALLHTLLLIRRVSIVVYFSATAWSIIHLGDRYLFNREATTQHQLRDDDGAPGVNAVVKSDRKTLPSFVPPFFNKEITVA